MAHESVTVLEMASRIAAGLVSHPSVATGLLMNDVESEAFRQSATRVAEAAIRVAVAIWVGDAQVRTPHASDAAGD